MTEAKTDTSRPFISVIVPVRDDARRLARLLEMLARQTYPPDRRETIVIDNGSTDNTIEVAESFGVKTLREPKHGSYAARNRGADAAQGDLFAFIDSDCEPAPNWLEAGALALERQKTPLVGGRVRFRYTQTPTASELYDSIANMRIRENIETRQVCVTANLFVAREAFERAGPFPERLASGGDFYFTARASSLGYPISYAPDAIVDHPTRQFRALLRKSFRTGRGKSELKRMPQDKTTARRTAAGHGLLSRLTPWGLRRLLIESKITATPWKLSAITCVSWLVFSISALGFIAGELTRNPLSKENR